ncbi:MAG: hypothetical protein R6T92_10720 [Desulfosalsimonadaceae bacterium]
MARLKRPVNCLNENRLFCQSLRQAKILILKIRRVFLRLKFSPSLTLTKNPDFRSGTDKRQGHRALASASPGAISNPLQLLLRATPGTNRLKLIIYIWKTPQFPSLLQGLLRAFL